MVTEIREYTSADEIAETLEKKISETKSTLGGYLRQLDDIREVAEKSKKIRDVLMKLADKKNQAESLGEITVGNLTIVLNTNPFHELAAIEEAVRSHQQRLMTLQKAQKALKWLDQVGDTKDLKYLVIEENGLPNRILFKIT